MGAHWRGPDNPRRGHAREERNRLALYDRCREVIEYLIECNGHSPLSKRELADEMADRYGRVWRTNSGEPDRRLIADVCTATRDQDRDPFARELFAGLVISYAPNTGGLILIDPTGEMALPHQLHMLAGDMQEQQKAKTIMRRRISAWRTAALSAMSGGDFELGRLLSQAENEIDSTGFVSDTIVVLLLKMFAAKGVARGEDPDT